MTGNSTVHEKNEAHDISSENSDFNWAFYGPNFCCQWLVLFFFVETGSQIVLFRLQTSKFKVENRTRRGIKDEQSS